ncbi:hypothetical protein E6C60_2737 [Paenibacillus algicola]|uniref:Uncharacterized protein n=1 Tax=Paenibacillus algicola TaxID=2565926 RepID=A0A4P8XS75_9BACL|nr:hypothetical protein E6C60_2737 [Paenibacillus algicola]
MTASSLLSVKAYVRAGVNAPQKADVSPYDALLLKAACGMTFILRGPF